MNPRTLKAMIRSKLNPSPEDLAARDWRGQGTLAAPSDSPLVVFCAPLAGRAWAKDWGVISATLARTIASLQAQTDPNWRLLITSQDRPDGWPEDDPRLIFLPFTQPVEGMDKGYKVHALMAALPDAMAGQDGYMHALDADDVLHPGLVAHIRSDNNGRGYWHKTGGMVDVQTDVFARCGPRSLRYPLSRPFLAQCGSCAAIYVDFRDGSSPYAGLATRFYTSGHRNFLRAARAHGVRLDPIPFPAALYLMNTGENDRERIGKMHLKMDYLRQCRLPKATAARWRDDFGWDALNAAASAPTPAAIPQG